MNILVLNGSPRATGNTLKLIRAFTEGAESAGNEVHIVDVYKLKVNDCIGCEYCHTDGHTVCVQQDDMQIVYDLLKDTDMVVVASPIYYHSVTGQIKCVIDRFYSVMSRRKLEKLKSAAMILCSADPDVYDGAKYLFVKEFEEFMGLENKGIFTACYADLEDDSKYNELREFGASLK